MDMWITHNKSKVEYSTYAYTYPTTYAPVKYEQAKCLITYYGYTNETCWYVRIIGRRALTASNAIVFGSP